MAICESTREALNALGECVLELQLLESSYSELAKDWPPAMLSSFARHIFRLSHASDALDDLMYQRVLPLLSDFSKVQGGSK